MGTPFVSGLMELITKSGRYTLHGLKEIFKTTRHRTPLCLRIFYSYIFHFIRIPWQRERQQKTFNELLKLYRSEILPEMVQDSDELPVGDKMLCERLNPFRVLHSLVHITELADKAFRDISMSLFQYWWKVWQEIWIGHNQTCTESL